MVFTKDLGKESQKAMVDQVEARSRESIFLFPDTFKS
jgi:hypothetical protein